MSVSAFPLANRADGGQVFVTVDENTRIVSPSGVVVLAPGEAVQLAALLARVSATEVDSLPACRCVVCQCERAQGLRP